MKNPYGAHTTVCLFLAPLVTLLFVAVLLPLGDTGVDKPPTPRPLDDRRILNVNSTAWIPLQPLYRESDAQVGFCTFVRTHAGQRSALLALLSSLAAARPPTYRVFLVNTGADEFPDLPLFVSRANKFTGEETFIDLTSMVNTIKRNNSSYNPPWNDYGYIATDVMLEQVLGDPVLGSMCDYLTFTNGDNLYSLHTFTAVLGKIQDGYNLVGFNFASHHEWAMPWKWWGCNSAGPSRSGSDVEVFAKFAPTYIDLGAFVVSRELLDGANLRFIIHLLPSAKQPDSVVGADGYFITRAAEDARAIPFIIPRLLLVHQ
jgi:hypothetical protein